jgi:hypothetical protein
MPIALKLRKFSMELYIKIRLTTNKKSIFSKTLIEGKIIIKWLDRPKKYFPYSMNAVKFSMENAKSPAKLI